MQNITTQIQVLHLSVLKDHSIGNVLANHYNAIIIVNRFKIFTTKLFSDTTAPHSCSKILLVSLNPFTVVARFFWHDRIKPALRVIPTS